MSATRTSFDARLAARIGAAPSARPAPAAAVVARNSRRSIDVGHGSGESFNNSDNGHLLSGKRFCLPDYFLSSECLGHFWRVRLGKFWKAPKTVALQLKTGC